MAQFFAHLHNHSAYSLLDGYSKLEDMVKKTKEQGLTHIAITEHGNTFSLVPFYKIAKKEGITPILGCEFYWHPVFRGLKELGSQERKRHYHLTILAKNNEGYQNLLKLVSIANSEGMYYKPQIDDQVLFEHKSGLIVLSGCISGYISRLLQEGETEEALSHARKYQSELGEDFYLEMQNHDDIKINPSIVSLIENDSWHNICLTRAKTHKTEKDVLKSLGKKKYIENYKQRLLENLEQNKAELEEIEKRTREGLKYISDITGVKLVCTNDSHYINREDAYMQDVFFALGQEKWLLDIDRYSYSTDTFFLRDKEDMEETFKDYPQALESTREIALKCNVEIEELELTKQNMYQLPHYPDVPKGQTEADYLRELCDIGWKKLVKPRIDAGVIPESEYRERLEFELKTIIDMGWAGYFLIVQDITDFARKNNIPLGFSRGSAGGSLVSFLVGIVKGDPLYLPIENFLGEQMKVDLLFERFLNPDRISLPD